MEGHEFTQTKYRLSVGNPKTYQNLNKVRLSNKAVLDKVNGNNRLKRRISTAGTSKRFPKDFFKIETDEEKPSKSPIFCFKMKRNIFEDMIKKKLEEKKAILRTKRKELDTN